MGGDTVDDGFTRLSRRLSFVLRHRPDSHGLTLDPHGWVEVTALLGALTRHGPAVDRATLDEVVRTNDKRRYEVRRRADGSEWIRASQGHSRTVPVDLGLTPVTPPDVLFHGTAAVSVPSIMDSGLRAGRRHHVHLSADAETARAVGLRRRTAAAVLEIDAAAMAAAGHLFYRSANGVWLTAGVPAGFLKPTPKATKT